MEFVRPTTFADALAEKAARPQAVPILGGTDLMVGLNAGHPPPPALLDLTAVAELDAWAVDDDEVWIGAGVTYRRLITELGTLCPGLALAARTVGSPQIRNRATLAGNLGTASPGGDTHPVLLATGAVVEAASVRGQRAIPIDDFYAGVKRHALAPDELIRGVRLPIRRGPQQFAKVGTRNAMVIAVCSVAVALDVARRTVRVGVGSVAPTPRRALAAEDLASGLPWDGGPLDDDVARRFGAAVAAATAPIDDVRGTAAYRRHSVEVLARRTLAWALADLDRSEAWDGMTGRSEA
ncbi:MAG: FAD binding domain-containing protein [Micromonosporaceae bacterium]|nr:FAD binding domain-containing protein [Micromonosporaceae bacterium]